MLRRLSPIVVACFCATAAAAGSSGVHFAHHDWEVACDNTRTCRAAGYQREEDDMRVSVLLTRRAGPEQAVEGQVILAEDHEAIEPGTLKVTLEIDGAANSTFTIGRTQFAEAEPLPRAQVDALLAALRGDSEIVFVAGARRWRLSDRGASAVLLKMDDVQGRLGTPGALVRRGTRDEASVLPPLPAPVVRAVRIPVPREADAGLAADPALLQALRGAMARDQCTPGEDGVDADDAEPTVARLDDDKLLVSVLCWRAFYNEGWGYWVVDAAPPHGATLVTTSAQAPEHVDETITRLHKGRSAGDCLDTDTWTWDGANFVHTTAATTGMCRQIAAGGAWELPTRVSEVVPAQ